MKKEQFISLIALIVVGIGSTHYVVSQIPEKITQKMLAIEYDKVGGMKNYVKINKIQKEQIINGLKQYEAQNGEVKAPIENNNIQDSSNSGNKISLEQVKKVTGENTYILGNKDAEVTWVEYSDLECPYCKGLHESGTIEDIIKNYDGKVNFIFKQFPLGFHKQALMESQAALCVGELGGNDKYYDFIQKTYNGSKTDGNSYTKDDMAKLGASIGLDAKKLLSCIESNKFKDLADSQTIEGQKLFGITGTPGNVLINNKTGEWDKLPGAYPTSAFKQKIDSLLSK